LDNQPGFVSLSKRAPQLGRPVRMDFVVYIVFSKKKIYAVWGQCRFLTILVTFGNIDLDSVRFLCWIYKWNSLPELFSLPFFLSSPFIFHETQGFRLLSSHSNGKSLV